MSDGAFRSTRALKREISRDGGGKLVPTMLGLWPYIWPSSRRDLKLRVMVAMVLLLFAKLASIAVPFTFKWATDALAIAFLMVSRLPVFSGKRVGKRVAPEMVLPVFVLVVLFFALLIAYPWIVLTTGTICYLASLPFGFMSYRNYERRSVALAQPAVAAPAAPGAPAEREASAPARAPVEPPNNDPERPVRLN